MTEPDIIPPVAKPTRKTRLPAVKIEIPQEEQSFSAQIARFIKDPAVDADKLEKLVNLQRQIMSDEAKAAFNIAMGEAQAEMEPVVRKEENKHTKSKFAKLEQIDKAIRPIYSKHGFALTSTSSKGEKGVKIITEVLHNKGHSKIYELEGDLDIAGSGGTNNKTPIQGLGSTTSYLRRYLECMIFNVMLVNEDNDGNKDKENKNPKVTEAQVLLIEDYLSATDSNRENFLRAYKVQNISDMDVLQFNHAVEQLKKKEAGLKNG